MDTGRIWWCADNQAEADRWKANFLARGAIAVELRPESDRPIVDVFITLERAKALQVLGTEVGEEEWLETEPESGPATVEADRQNG